MGHTVIRSAFYRPQRSCLQGNVFTPVCHSVHRGGVSQHALGSHDQPPLYNTGVGWQTPPGHPCPHRHPTRQTPMPSQTPSQADTPLGRHPLLGRHPILGGHPLGRTPPLPSQTPLLLGRHPPGQTTLPPPPETATATGMHFCFKEYVGGFFIFFLQQVLFGENVLF